MKKSELKQLICEEIKRLIEDNYKIGDIIKFKDGEEWIVSKPGLRYAIDRLKSNEVYVKPYNKLAKSRNVSLGIDLDMDYIKKNKVNESLINESSIVGIGNKISADLTKFLKTIVIPKSKGYVNDERDAAALLYDIIRHRYNFK